MQYNYFFTVALGILPSIIWLVFYLRKDIHPEPKKWLFMVFLAGMAITPIVVLAEQQATGFFNFLNSILPHLFSSFVKNIAVVFISMAVIEEFSKYLIVSFTMKHNPVFDEPEDAMIYMIVAALGFAAIENTMIMNLYAPAFFFDPAQPLYILLLRFVGATFLHTLTSAIVGFYYAISLCKEDICPENPRLTLTKGIIIAVLLHGFFNYFIIVLHEASAIYFSIPLFIVAIFVLHDFKILQGISPKKFNRITNRIDE